MTKTGNIEQSGVIKEITDGVIKVQISVQSACASCRLKGVCDVDSQAKLIEVHQWTGTYHKGDYVNVILKESLGLKALFFGYGVPFLLLVSSLLIVMGLTDKEGLSALVAIASLVPYYWVLYLSKDKMQKTFSFDICKNENY